MREGLKMASSIPYLPLVRSKVDLPSDGRDCFSGINLSWSVRLRTVFEFSSVRLNDLDWSSA